jgi:dolichol-phosphate mannosyltransferase
MKRCNYELAIVIPVVNELSNLKLLVPQIRRLQPRAQIILIDDNSTDGTKLFFTSYYSDTNFHYIYRPARLGIGNAHKFGLDFARELNCRYVVTLDGDFTHDPVYISNILECLEDSPVVITNRYNEIDALEEWSILRRALTLSAHFLTRVFFNSRLDMSTGYRGYDLKSIPTEELCSRSPDNYDFFFVSTIMLLKRNIKIQSLPIRIGHRQFGSSKMSFTHALLGITKLFLFGFRIMRIP